MIALAYTSPLNILTQALEAFDGIYSVNDIQTNRGNHKTYDFSFQDTKDIKTTLNGDSNAFDALVERYEKDIARQMWKYTQDRRDLEELVQDVFVKAYLNLDSFRGNGSFLHWLRVIATNTGYDYWKEQKRMRESSPHYLDDIKYMCRD